MFPNWWIIRFVREFVGVPRVTQNLENALIDSELVKSRARSPQHGMYLQSSTEAVVLIGLQYFILQIQVEVIFQVVEYHSREESSTASSDDTDFKVRVSIITVE